MSENLEELDGLHAEWRRLLNDMIASGADSTEAVEAMLTVGLAEKLHLHGPTVLSYSLRVVLGTLEPHVGAEATSEGRKVH